MAGAVAIYSPHDDIRLLLRSLLRLHHYEVVAEGSTPGELRGGPTRSPMTVVLDAELDEVGWSEAVAAVRKARPDVRFLLVTPSRSPRTDAQARNAGIPVVLHRPFALRQLVEAMNLLDPSAAAPATGAVTP